MADEDTDLVLQSELDNALVIAAMAEMAEAAEQMANSSSQELQKVAEGIKGVSDVLKGAAEDAHASGETFVAMFSDAKISSHEFRQHVLRLLGDVRRAVKDTSEEGVVNFEHMFGAVRDVKTTDLAKLIKTDLAQADLEKFRETTDRLIQSTTPKLRKLGVQIRALGENYQENVEDVDALDRSLRELITQAEKAEKAFGEVQIDPLTKKLQVQQATVSMQKFTEITTRMLQSADSEARSLGITFRQLRSRLARAFDAGEISAEEFNKEMRRLETEARRTGKALGTEVSQGADKAQVSVWKLANALDRVGIRGGGGLLRVVDAFKTMNPLILAGVVALAGMAVTLNKVGRIALDVGKKVTDMFVGVIKSSTETAQTFELSERQLTNIFKGKEDIARATLDRILDLSAQFGVDLTGEVARVFLPLVESFEQFREIGEIASTLAIGFGRTETEVTRALKQAQAGRFRPLIELFGLLASDIERIKELQADLGDTAGLIAGMQAFFDRTGQQWDTYENTLQRVRGTLDVLRKQVELALGEPVKEALVEQINRILDTLNESKTEIMALASALGSVVGNFVGNIGEAFDEFVRGIDFDDLFAIIDELDVLFTDVAGLAGTLIDENAFKIVASLTLIILETLDEIVFTTRNWVAVLKEVASILPDIPGLTAGGEGVGEKPVRRAIERGLAAAVPGAGVAITALRGVGQVGQELRADEIEEETKALERQREERKKFIQSLWDSIDALGSQADAVLDENAAETEFKKLQEEATTAAETLGEAREKLATQLRDKLAGIAVETGRRILDIEIANSRKREDIYRQFAQRVRDLAIRTVQEREQAELDFSRRSDDLDKEYGRRKEDLDRERAENRIKIEEDFRRRLEDIRKRFDFDAQEAIRKNDAVALLRIRRRMQFELDQAKDNRDRQVEDANVAAEQRRMDLQRWLEREREDLNEAERRKLDDLKIAADERAAELVRQLDDELLQQQVAEQRKQEDLQEWQKRQLEDYQTFGEQKVRDLNAQYEEELKVIARFENELVRQTIAAWQRAAGIRAQFIGGGRTGVTAGGGGGGGISGRVGGRRTAGGSGTTTAQLVGLAQSLASQTGNTELISRINQMNREELLILINDLQNQVRNLPGRAVGGRVAAGMSALVGERGPERFTPTQAGIVSPRVPLLFSPGGAGPGSIVTDNSRNLSADVSLLDPSSFSPIQLSIIRSLISEQLLDAMF